VKKKNRDYDSMTSQRLEHQSDQKLTDFLEGNLKRVPAKKQRREVILDYELNKKLEKFAYDNRWTIPDVQREALRQFLKKHGL
jgi:hypothetical protein